MVLLIKTCQKIRASTCESYGCCWGAYTTRGYQCYKSSTAPIGGCVFGYDGASKPNINSTTTAITQCGDSCCRGDNTHGSCAWSLGYANPQDSSGDACYKYKNAAINNNRNGWYVLVCVHHLCSVENANHFHSFFPGFITGQTHLLYASMLKPAEQQQTLSAKRRAKPRMVATRSIFMKEKQYVNC